MGIAFFVIALLLVSAIVCFIFGAVNFVTLRLIRAILFFLGSGLFTVLAFLTFLTWIFWHIIV